jgi:hypothetical protein
MNPLERFDREMQAAEGRGDFDEAAGWAKMMLLADPGELRWKAMVGLMLAKSAAKHADAQDHRAAARAARQSRHAMADFNYPTGAEPIDGVIETAEEVYEHSCRELGLSYPGHRQGIESSGDLIGHWINALDGFQTRSLDFVRIAGTD